MEQENRGEIMEPSRTGLERTIGLIYDAALDVDRWPEALQSISEYLDTPFIYLIVDDKKSGGEPFCLGINMPGDDLQREYQSEIFAIDPRVAFARARPDLRLTYDYLHTSEAEMNRDRYYADWLRRSGLRYYMASTLIDGPDLTAFATVQRSSEQGHVQAVDIEAFEPLIDHLRRAILISRRLVETDARAATANEFVEGLPAGVVMLDNRGRVVSANRKIREIFSRMDALTSDDGTIRALRAIDDQALQAAIGSALAVTEGRATTGGGDLRLVRRDDDRPYIVTVSPLGCGVPLFGATPPAVMVLVTDPAATPHLSTAVLRRRWGLTAREAEIALHVVSGRSSTEIADALSLSPRTVEVHLRNVFSKTGARRQTDLVRLLMTTPVLR